MNIVAHYAGDRQNIQVTAVRWTSRGGGSVMHLWKPYFKNWCRNELLEVFLLALSLCGSFSQSDKIPN